MGFVRLLIWFSLCNFFPATKQQTILQLLVKDLCFLRVHVMHIIEIPTNE